MTVNDDPFVWFYYIYGHTILPPVVFLWFYHRAAGGKEQWADSHQAQPGYGDARLLAHAY